MVKYYREEQTVTKFILFVLSTRIMPNWGYCAKEIGGWNRAKFEAVWYYSLNLSKFVIVSYSVQISFKTEPLLFYSIYEWVHTHNLYLQNSVTQWFYKVDLLL